jgi:tRNA U34 2-thiouridine synthase MnmA/TrmU
MNENAGAVGQIVHPDTQPIFVAGYHAGLHLFLLGQQVSLTGIF